jgi:hypothetical protein
MACAVGVIRRSRTLSGSRFVGGAAYELRMLAICRGRSYVCKHGVMAKPSEAQLGQLKAAGPEYRAALQSFSGLA